jgi:hypothetical protein
VRGEHWLNAARLRSYPRLLIAIFAFMTIVRLASIHHMVDSVGNPVGADFILQYGASLAALQGHAAEAYTAAGIMHYEQLAVPAWDKTFLWFYPPSWYVLILPLALLPYLISYVVYMSATLAFFIAVMRRMALGPECGQQAMWCLAAFSGVWINVNDGQNAFLTAGCAGAAVLCLQRRPWMAGVFLGLLSVKPHLGLLFPVALVAIGAWRTIVSALATAAGLMAVGTLVLGRAVFAAWLGSIGSAGTTLDGDGLTWAKMPAVYSLLRMLGVRPGIAHWVHGAVAMVVIALVWWVWRSSADWGLRGSALMVGTFLISPYVFDYDLVWLAFPIAWLALKGVREGWLRWEREVLVAAWILPLAMAPIASATRLQTGPLVLGTLLWVVARRVRMEALPISAPAPGELRTAMA